jgi:hypothetical protein
MRRNTLFLTIVAVLVLISGLGGAMTASSLHAHAMSTPDAAIAVPSSLTPPNDAILLFEFAAQGDQIYTCEATAEDPTTFAWTFKAPEAELRNDRGEVVATHFAGPTWEGSDGSTVVAGVLERAEAPSNESIPWLLLEANAHEGSGAFSTISYIQRFDTEGGIVPATGCDAAHAQVEVRVPYEATYAFYYPAAA